MVRVWVPITQIHRLRHTNALEECSDVTVVQLQVLSVLLGIGLQWDHGLLHSIDHGGPQLFHQGLTKPH